MENNALLRTKTVIANRNSIPMILGVPEASVVFCPETGDNYEKISNALSRKYRVRRELTEDARFEVAYGAKTTSLPFVKMVESVDIIGEVSDCFGSSADCSLAVTDTLTGDEESIASAYGSIVSRLLRITDYRVGALAFGGKEDARAINSIRSAVLSFMKTAPTAKSVVATACSVSSALDGLEVEGGEEQMTRAVALILERESRKPLRKGILSLICASILNEVYKYYLTTEFGLIAPPDNNARIDQAVEFMGLSETRLIKTVLPIIKPGVMDKINGAVRLHRGEILAEICYHGMIFKRAMGVMKRLLPDKGYELSKSLDKSDLSLAMALAPDLSTRSERTLMNVMKNRGVLDNFLL